MSLDEVRNFSLVSGDLLFARQSLVASGVGKCSIFIGAKETTTFESHIIRVRLNKKDTVPDFYFHFFNSNFGFSTIRSLVTQIAAAGIRGSELARIFIPLPPTLNEQRAIADALSDVDAQITALDEAIAKKRDIKQGAMQRLLTGEERLPGFSGAWEVKRLGEILAIKHGKSQKDVIDPNGKYPIFATGGVLGWAREPLYTKPSVLIGRKGTIDIPRYMDSPFWSVDTLFYSEIFENNEPKFIYYKFNLIDWYSHNEASGVPSLNARTIEAIEIKIPPTVEEQKAIAAVLSDMDEEIGTLEAQSEKTVALKQGMMQELLTGKTRLI